MQELKQKQPRTKTTLRMVLQCIGFVLWAIALPLATAGFVRHATTFRMHSTPPPPNPNEPSQINGTVAATTTTSYVSPAEAQKLTEQGRAIGQASLVFSIVAGTLLELYLITKAVLALRPRDLAGLQARLDGFFLSWRTGGLLLAALCLVWQVDLLPLMAGLMATTVTVRALDAPEGWWSAYYFAAEYLAVPVWLAWAPLVGHLTLIGYVFVVGARAFWRAVTCCARNRYRRLGGDGEREGFLEEGDEEDHDVFSDLDVDLPTGVNMGKEHRVSSEEGTLVDREK